MDSPTAISPSICYCGALGDTSKTRTILSNKRDELAKLSPRIFPETDVSAVARVYLEPLQNCLSFLQNLLEHPGAKVA